MAHVHFTNLLQTASGLQLNADEVLPLLKAAEIERIVYDPPVWMRSARASLRG